MNTAKIKLTAIALLALCSLALKASAGTYANITIDGDTSDWASVPVAYANENGVNNPTGVDFQNLYLANDDNYFYVRFTLQAAADVLNGWNTYIWIDNDNNPATGYHPFGNPNFGSSLMIINDNAYQQAEGGWNEGALAIGTAAYGAPANPGTDYEFRIARNATGVAGIFTGVPLLDNATVKVQLASETGTGDSLPAWDNYGTLNYSFAVVPEPGTVTLVGLGLLMTVGLAHRRKKD